MGRNSIANRRARKAATPETETPKAEAPTRQVLKTLDEQQRGMIDPLVRRVNAMRMQVTEAGQQVDMMLTLLHPAFEKGDVSYDPQTGEFFKPLTGKKAPAPKDPTEQVVKGPMKLERSARKRG